MKEIKQKSYQDSNPDAGFEFHILCQLITDFHTQALKVFHQIQGDKSPAQALTTSVDAISASLACT